MLMVALGRYRWLLSVRLWAIAACLEGQIPTIYGRLYIGDNRQNLPRGEQANERLKGPGSQA